MKLLVFFKCVGCDAHAFHGLVPSILCRLTEHVMTVQQVDWTNSPRKRTSARMRTAETSWRKIWIKELVAKKIKNKNKKFKPFDFWTLLKTHCICTSAPDEFNKCSMWQKLCGRSFYLKATRRNLPAFKNCARAFRELLWRRNQYFPRAFRTIPKILGSFLSRGCTYATEGDITV